MEREMHILMLNNEYPPLGGGAGVVNKRVIRALSALPDLRADLITSTAEGRTRHEQIGAHARIFYERIRKRNMHHFTIAEFLQYCVAAYRRSRSLASAERYDCLLAWNAVPVGFLAFLLHRILRVPYVIRMAGPDIPGWEARYNGLHRIIRPLLLRALRSARAVVVKCKREADAVAACCPQAHIVVIQNGVELPAEISLSQSDPHAPLRLLSVGRLIPLKHQDDMMQAVRQLRDRGIAVSLEIVGEGDAAEAYERIREELDLAVCVRFVGRVDHTEIGQRYAGADVFLMASDNEAMSNAMLEAMAYGLPVITTPVGGAEELIEDGANGLLFPHRDVATLTDHIARLAADRQELARMGRAARATAERFSADESCRRYAELLRH